MGWESASTASVGAADGAACIACTKLGEKCRCVRWSGKKFSGVFDDAATHPKIYIYRPLAALTGVCPRYKKLG